VSFFFFFFFFFCPAFPFSYFVSSSCKTCVGSSSHVSGRAAAAMQCSASFALFVFAGMQEKVSSFEPGRFGECKEALGLFSEVISATWMCAGCALECFGID
jgi:hypothetical protein